MSLVNEAGPVSVGEKIDGTAVAKSVREDVAREVAELKARGITPGLTVVIVGEDPASQTYVAAKEKASVEAGMKGETIRLPADTPQPELEAPTPRCTGFSSRVRSPGTWTPTPSCDASSPRRTWMAFTR